MKNKKLLKNIIEKISNEAIKKKIFIITAESCTGGLISSALTSLSGSSNFFDKGYVTYSNNSKIKLLNVSPKTLKKYGAVSEEVVKEMVSGCYDKNQLSVSLAISGVAGPGRSENKPVGMIWVAIKTQKNLQTKLFEFGNKSRKKIRTKSVFSALKFLLKTLKEM